MAYIYGTTGNDTLNGTPGDDYIDGEEGADTVDAGDGDDSVRSEIQADGTKDVRLDGGAGTDFLTLVVYSPTIGVTLNFSNPSVEQSVAGMIVVNFERLYFYGDAAADNITGGALDDWLWGYGGNDLLAGGGGDDLLDGGVGNDSLSGGDGDDTINSRSYYDGATTYKNLDVLIDGGAGTDFALISKFYSTVGMTLSIADPTVSYTIDGTTVRGIERIEFHAGTGAENITGFPFGPRTTPRTVTSGSMSIGDGVTV